MSEPEPSRDQYRSRRRRTTRARTVSVKRMTKRERDLGRKDFPDAGRRVPATRGDCVNGLRPCPFVACVHHLYLDVSPKTGAIKLNFPDVDPDEIPETCALDVAEQGGESLEVVGELMNMTRERLRQIEVLALARLQRHPRAVTLLEGDDESRVPCRVLPEDDDASDDNIEAEDGL